VLGCSQDHVKRNISSRRYHFFELGLEGGRIIVFMDGNPMDEYVASYSLVCGSFPVAAEYTVKRRDLLGGFDDDFHVAPQVKRSSVK
jgi:hypothetical protein